MNQNIKEDQDEARRFEKSVGMTIKEFEDFYKVKVYLQNDSVYYESMRQQMREDKRFLFAYCRLYNFPSNNTYNTITRKIHTIELEPYEHDKLFNPSQCILLFRDRRDYIFAGVDRYGNIYTSDFYHNGKPTPEIHIVMNFNSIIDEFVHPTVTINVAVLPIMDKIRQHKQKQQFSVLFKGWWNGNTYYVSEEFYIPKQKVSKYTVTYKECLENFIHDGYTVLIHSHPNSTDDKFIHFAENEIDFFECSLLHTPKGITDSKIILGTPSARVQITPAEIVYNYPEIKVIGLENIM